jgi:hypothetical protein
LCFIDTETDGLQPGRRVWEVALIRREESGRQHDHHFFVALDLRYSDPAGLRIGGYWDRHPTGRKLAGKDPVPPRGPVLSNHDAAREVMTLTFGAHLVGAVPNFDAETLANLLRSQGYLPAWHYHLIDVESLAVGYLECMRRRGIGENGADADPIRPPWKSDDLSLAVGVDPPADEDRHTAMGDARWAMRLYDAITGGSGG